MSNRRRKQAGGTAVGKRLSRLAGNLVLELVGFGLILALFLMVQEPRSEYSTSRISQRSADVSEERGDLQAYVTELLSGAPFGSN